LTAYQPNLFAPTAYGGTAPIPAPTPLAANGDPWTSHEAAERAHRSGKVTRHRAIALALVRAHPGCTGHELWAAASDAERAELESHHELYRRLSDERHAGNIAQGEARACSIKRTKMVTWWPSVAAEGA
jgi:hypothetical protein